MSKGCPWNEQACRNAAGEGHLNGIDCEILWEVLKIGSEPQLECLKYMQDNGLEWDQYDKYVDSTKK